MVSLKEHVNFPQMHLAQQIAKANIFSPTQPYKVTFALTYQCNLRCKFCKTWAREQKSELSTRQIKSILDSAHWLKWLHLTGGEIFLREDIDEILGFLIAEKKLAILTFATNGFSSGSILKSVRRLIPAMRNTKLIITCSLDGTKEVHDKLRGVSGAYDRCLETFTQLRAFKTVNAYLGVTVSKENHLDLPLLLSDLKKKIEGFRFDETHFNFAQESFFYNNVGALPSGRVMDNEVYMSVQALRRIHKKNNKKFKDLLENRYFEFMPKYLTEKKAPLKCSALGGSCFIDPYGDIYPCMGFEAKIGNLSEAGYDLKEFWKLFFKRKDEVRKSIQEHKCPGCWTACEAYPSILNNLLLRPQ